MDRKTTQIVMGSEHSYKGLMETAQKNKADWWSCGKDTKEGDLLFFYFKKPKSEIVALATAAEDAKPDEEYPYVVHIKDVKRIEPISLEKMRGAFRKWGWLKRTRNLTYLDNRKSEKLLKLAGLYERPHTSPLAEDLSTFEKYSEGARFSVTINAYERNPKARAACIAHHGHVCAVCGFDFVRVYGGFGEGYIHVHHVVPIGKIGKEYRIDPISDLIPICPNCHAMIHRAEPPLTVEQLRRHIGELKKLLESPAQIRHSTFP